MTMRIQEAILRVLETAVRPMTAAEIAEVLSTSTNVVGGNLGYMRAGRQVICRRVNTGKVRRFGWQIFTEMVRHWTTPARRKELSRFSLVDPRPHRRQPRTDDMRQMLEDIQRAHFHPATRR